MSDDPANRPTFEEVLAMKDEDIAELSARCNTIAVTELERLIGVIDGLVLPDNYSASDRHMDACCRAGIKGVIRDRIAEIRGRCPFGPDSAAEQFVATGAAIERPSFTATLYSDNGPPIKRWQERAMEPKTYTPAELGVDTSLSPETIKRLDDIEREAAETMRAIQLDKTVFR